MRMFLLLAFLAVAWGAPARKGSLPWDEWNKDLGITGPGSGQTREPRVCWDMAWDGSPIRVCCEGYTGPVEENCPTPVCDDPCLNGGTCGAPNHCVCNNAYTGETCETLKKKEYIWSDWVNVDEDRITGDFETLFEIREILDVCRNTVPEHIECRPVGEHSNLNDQVYTCNRRLGLACRNDEQLNGECYDYEVRILCPVKGVATKTGFTCIHRTLEYNSGEVVKDGDCLGCECQLDGHWECHEDPKYCDTGISTTPAPRFPWLPPGVQSGQCMVGETIFNHGDTTTLDCQMCTCDATRGWSCVDIDDPTCVAPPSDDYCRIDNHFVFFHGQTAKKDCNTCICKNSAWDCTQTICPDKSTRADYYLQCVNPKTSYRHDDGEIVARDCNVCVCTQGKWDCTRDSCEEGTSEDSDVTLSTREVCTTPTGLPYPHGATISQDCNACKCFDGKWQCTRRFCSPETYPNSTCVDEVTASLVKSGQTIRRGCDVCLCNGGNLTCTTKPCATNNGICFDEQRRFATTSTSFDRQYRPVCNRNGTFSPIQCNPLHGVCFCVTTLGHVIPGTSVKQGTGSPDCSPYATDDTSPLAFTMPSTQTGNFPCIERVQDTTTRLTGYNTPKCLANGYFAPLQCDAHTGVCYCVTKEGTTIPGSVLHATQGRPNCDVARDDTPVSTTTERKTPCQQERDNAERHKLPFKPECDRTGRYQPLQTNPMLNIRFCVDVNGVVLEQTITKSSFIDCQIYSQYVEWDIMPYTSKVFPNREPHTPQTYPVKDIIHNTPRCKLQRLISQFVDGVFHPSCQEDGRYRPEQCPSGTDLCFCVDVTGAVIPETVRRVGYLGANCDDYQSVFDVITPTNTTTIVIHPEISLIHPGWETKLTEVERTRLIVGRQYTRNSKPRVIKTNVTECIRQQQIATLVPGVFRPSCHRNGTFNTVQHQPYSRQVYCVDKYGVKIEGTERTLDSQPMPDCTPYWNTTVQMIKVRNHWTNTPQDTTVTEPIPLDSLFPAGLHHHPNCTRQQEITSRLEGAVVPTCEPNGTYTPLQCNATTGVCYCMLPYGDILPDTVLPMVKGTPSCWHVSNVSIHQSTTPVPNVCRLPVVQGPCGARFIHWAFSKLLNKCHMFVYSGCRGNENRFQTKEECENTCGYLTPPTDPRPPTCERKLAHFNRMNFAQRLTMKRPMCTPDGNYKPTQCHLSRADDDMIQEVCQCVHRVTGEVQSCETEQPTMNQNPEEHVVISTGPSPAPEIEGCVWEGVTYHRDDEFFKHCNPCICLGNNEASCSRNPCQPYSCYRNGVMKTSYDEDCQRCTCIGGSWDCTEKQNCRTNQEPASVVGTATECWRKSGEMMTIGSFYWEKCNKCTCMPDGQVTCGTKHCNRRHCHLEGQEFHNTDTIMKDCNECVCVGGLWECQEYTCDPVIRTRIRLEGCEYKGGNYLRDETFYDHCKLCHCQGNNSTNCERKYCNPTSCFVNGFEIRNADSRTIQCQTCTCFNGLMDCVDDLDCVHEMVDPIIGQVNTDTSIECHFEDKTYTNGDQFWKQCKSCGCFDDGRVDCDDKICSLDHCYNEGVEYETGAVLLTDVHQCTCFRGDIWDCIDKPHDAVRPDVIECSSERPAISCLTDPCDGIICPSHPDAVCLPDRCGRCRAVFFDNYGNRLRC